MLAVLPLINAEARVLFALGLHTTTAQSTKMAHDDSEDEESSHQKGLSVLFWDSPQKALQVTP